MDLSTGSTQILVIIEGFPQSEERFWPRFCSGIEQYADFRIEDPAEGVEKPSMRVDLFAVLLFQTKDDLDWRESGGAIVLGLNQLLISGN